MKAAAILLIAVMALPMAAQTAPTAATKTDRDDDTITLSVFTISEEKDRGYESMQTTSGMRTVQELRNVANSISVMNAQLIEDLGVLDIQEMSKWFVTGEQSPDPSLPNQLVFRGVRNSFAIRNGWIWYSSMDSYSTERVEVLRGPTAFLYGEADLGGANNQITKRGLFTRNLTRAKVMAGSQSLQRAELDLNRVLIKNKLAMRFAAVQSYTGSWLDNVRREFRGFYGAVTYRPFKQTTITVMGEYAKNTSVNSQGLFAEAFTRPTNGTLTATGGMIYVPAAGLMYRAQGRVVSTGSGAAVIDPKILPKNFHATGPNATSKNNHRTVSIEVEQHIGKNLHLLFSTNYYVMEQDSWGYSSRSITQDRSPLLPNGTPNPYFNDLYTEYFRTHNLNGNTVRDVRLSAVYDLNLSWMKQQFIVNGQQHQDNPGQKFPKYGEYVDPNSPLWTGTLNNAGTQAAFTANRTTFGNNRFVRRYYLKDGSNNQRNGDMRSVPGVSAWYPDMSNNVPASGQIIDRRFYTPSVGFGASGSYFNNHFFTLAGYREDHFNMKTTVGIPRMIENVWVVDQLPGAFAPNPNFVHYKVNGSNVGAVLRFNDAFAIAYNRAKSFRISIGEGADLVTRGAKQSIPTGEGQDLSARLSLLKGRLELSVTYYNNYQPNARRNPNLSSEIAARDELSRLFPATFLPTGQDYEKVTTKGTEVELMANITRSWRMTFNLATNKLITEDRLPLLKDFREQARAMGQATPALDAMLLKFPEGVPNAGYTKLRANMFTRYEFTRSKLKGLYVGGGVNWRDQTFRGNADFDFDGYAEKLWSPSYYLVSLLAGYRTKVANYPTTFALNVDNVFDREYYLSSAVGSGSWGAPMSFKVQMMMDF